MPKPIAPLDASEVKKAGSVEAALRLRDAGVKQTGELDGASEKQVVMEIITALEAKGYRRPSHWEPGTRGIYMRVGQHRADMGGSDKGVPDLIVVEFGDWRGFGNQTFLLEVKARTKAARVSKEQNTLAQLDIIHIVNSAAQVLAILEG